MRDDVITVIGAAIIVLLIFVAPIVMINWDSEPDCVCVEPK